MTYILGTGPPVNEWPGGIDMADIESYHTLNYDASMGFGLMHKFCIDVHASLYISYFNN